MFSSFKGLTKFFEFLLNLEQYWHKRGRANFLPNAIDFVTLQLHIWVSETQHGLFGRNIKCIQKKSIRPTSPLSPALGTKLHWYKSHFCPHQSWTWIGLTAGISLKSAKEPLINILGIYIISLILVLFYYYYVIKHLPWKVVP